MGKIYTKTGDKGYTSLTGGQRVKKDSARVEAYGTIDEINGMIGYAISKMDIEELEPVKKMLENIQRDLFHVGAELSTPSGNAVYWPLDNKQIEYIEQSIDFLEGELEALTQFILPGGSEVGSLLHVIRTMVRRGERTAVSLLDEGNILVVSYLNRLSDFMFVAARWVNMKNGIKETPFQMKKE